MEFTFNDAEYSCFLKNSSAKHWLSSTVIIEIPGKYDTATDLSKKCDFRRNFLCNSINAASIY